MTIEERSMLDELLALEEGLTGWELDFLDNLDRNHNDRDLTGKQREVLEKLWLRCVVGS